MKTMNKKKLKTFNVEWTETHTVIVKATDEIEAKEKAQNGDVITDENVELDAFDVYEIPDERKGNEKNV